MNNLDNIYIDNNKCIAVNLYEDEIRVILQKKVADVRNGLKINGRSHKYYDINLPKSYNQNGYTTQKDIIFNPFQFIESSDDIIEVSKIFNKYINKTGSQLLLNALIMLIFNFRSKEERNIKSLIKYLRATIPNELGQRNIDKAFSKIIENAPDDIICDFYRGFSILPKENQYEISATLFEFLLPFTMEKYLKWNYVSENNIDFRNNDERIYPIYTLYFDDDLDNIHNKILFQLSCKVI